MNYFYPFPPYLGYQNPYQGGVTPFQGNMNPYQPPAESDESSYIENILRLNLGKVEIGRAHV